MTFHHSSRNEKYNAIFSKCRQKNGFQIFLKAQDLVELQGLEPWTQ